MDDGWKTAGRLLEEDTAVRQALGASPHETTKQAAERVAAYNEPCMHDNDVHHFDVDSIGGHWELQWCADCGAIRRETAGTTTGVRVYEHWELPG